METESMLVRGIPPRLKGKIAKRVEREGSNLNDVAVAILARAFGVPFEPRQRRSSGPIGPYPNVRFEVPPPLKRAIEDEASARRDSIRNVVVEVLCSEFGVKFVPTARWPKRVAA